MTIRGKLVTAIVVAVAGLALTAGVGIWALNRVGGRLGAVQAAADARALALQLKFDVTDFNGWQTAYGYDDGASRAAYLASVRRFRGTLDRARASMRRREESALLDRIDAAAADFMRLDRDAWAALQAGRKDEVKRLLLGPEIENFKRAAAAADALAVAEDRYAGREEQRFKDARRVAMRYLIVAAILGSLLVVILLVTANDLARSAEGRLEAGDEREPDPGG